MKSIQTFIVAAACVALSAGAAANNLLTPPPPDIAAKAWLLTDVYSTQTLAAKDPEMRVEPASLTKLMTAYLTFKAIKQGTIKLTDVVPVSERAWRSEGSRMFIDLKTPVTVDELIHGMIIQSGNDACVALAERIAGSEEVFAQMMNREAARLGMKGTHYVNATGLPDPQHFTTARDLTILATTLIRDFPDFYPLYSQKEYTYNKIRQPNRNLLLYRDPNVDGMKTGHTEAAGYCLVASAKHDGRRVLSVVLGTTSDSARAAESSKLLNYGLQFFDTPKLYAANQPLKSVPVWKGTSNQVNIGFQRDLYLSLPKGSMSRIQSTLTTQQPLIAPLMAGQRVGTLKLALDGKSLGDYPVVVLSKVDQAGFAGRLWDSVKLMFK